MKIRLVNADAVLQGVQYVAEDLGIALVQDGADLTVTVTETKETKLAAALNGASAQIAYGGGKARFFRALAMVVQWARDGKKQAEAEQVPLFITNGVMGDMSRNCVFHVDAVKCILRKMALMGMNMYMLYTEDTYEIEGRPYFGYMRGRYTKDELKTLDAYADALGIELVPCIQTLGHLGAHLKWGAATQYKDSETTLLVGEPETYALIEDMLKTVKACFKTNRVHIGMDETNTLGRGRYLDLKGYRARSELYFEHLQKVYALTQAYGLKPMMWSDMFFRLYGKDLEGYIDYDPRVAFDESIKDYIPQGMQQVFWDYYNADEDFYTINLQKHKKYLDKNTMFAGGVWTFGGYATQFRRSYAFTIPALEACKKEGVKEVLATLWNNGSEGFQMQALPGLAWYADFDYTGKHDLDSVKECLRFSCGLDYDEIVQTELVEYPQGGNVGLSRALLFNDPLMGVVDKHLDGIETRQYYQKLTQTLHAQKSDKGCLLPVHEVMVALSSLFENKADFGVRLKKAYDAKDTETLQAMAQECTVCIEKVQALRNAHYKAWMYYNKPEGWEVYDIRYGGLCARFETTKLRLSQYLAGEIDCIHELAAERLYYHDVSNGELFGRPFLWEQYPWFASVNIL